MPENWRVLDFWQGGIDDANDCTGVAVCNVFVHMHRALQKCSEMNATKMQRDDCYKNAAGGQRVRRTRFCVSSGRSGPLSGFICTKPAAQA